MRIRCHFAAVCTAVAFLLAACQSPLVPDDEGGGESSGGKTTQDTLVVEVDTIEIIHTGTARDEYTVAEAQAIGKTDTAVWVKGYIVGTVKGSMKSGCQFEPPFTVETNVLIADIFPTSWWNCMPVKLDTEFRQYELSLVQNPDFLHEVRRIYGTIGTYFGVPGIVEMKIPSPWHPEEDDNPEPGDSLAAHGESLSAPLTVTEGIAAQGSEAYAETKWVRGYIVGVCTGKGKVTFADSLSVGDIATDGNVVLADSIGESSKEKIIVVQLSKGCIRDDVNLKEHPENLFRRFTVNGKLYPYNSLPGIRETLGAARRLDAFGNPLYLIE